MKNSRVQGLPPLEENKPIFICLHSTMCLSHLISLTAALLIEKVFSVFFVFLYYVQYTKVILLVHSQYGIFSRAKRLKQVLYDHDHHDNANTAQLLDFQDIRQ